MIKILFIRHAESEYSRDGIYAGKVDCNLTSSGLESAKKFGKTLDNSFDAIYCSPLKRAKQTLNAIFPEAHPIYDERISATSIGIWENQKKSSLDKHLVELFRKGLYNPPGAETHSDVDKRVCSFVEELFEQYQNNEKILVITHNGILRSVERNFIKSEQKLISDTLRTIILDNSNYDWYKSKEEAIK